MSEQDPLYDRIFRRLERVRWQLADIPYDEVDTGRVPEETLIFLRVNCLMELSSLYATRMFLRDFRALPDFCQFISIWYYEEMKHYLALREYLKRFGWAPEISELPQHDLELGESRWEPTLAMHYCGELRLGMWYHHWSDEAEEPVLGLIYRHIGNDEFRHAACYRDFMFAAVQEEPGRLLDFAQAAKWMLVNPGYDKHPTTMKSDADRKTAVTDLIEGYDVLHEKILRTITDADEDRLRQQVLTTFSTLSGRRLGSLSELAALARQLTRQQVGA